MDNYEIANFLRRDWRVRPYFRGVYPSNRLPKRLQRGIAHAFVINIDPDTKPGSHWVAVYFNHFGQATYFDSFGLSPYVPAIKTFITKNCNSLKYNSWILQSFYSQTCGLYCILFIKSLCRGQTLTYFLKRFNPLSQLYNDNVIRGVLSRW